MAFGAVVRRAILKKLAIAHQKYDNNRHRLQHLPEQTPAINLASVRQPMDFDLPALIRSLNTARSKTSETHRSMGSFVASLSSPPKTIALTIRL